MTDTPEDAAWASPPKTRKWLIASAAWSTVFTVAVTSFLIAEPASLVYRSMCLLGASGLLSAASGLVPRARLAKVLLGGSFVALAASFVFVFQAY